MKRQLITIILALAAVCSMWAQQEREVTITGDVKDGFLKTPLTDAKVAICRADSSVLDTAKITIYKSGDQPLYAVYSSKVKTDANAVLVHAWLQGYDDVWQSVNIAGQTEVEVPTLEMRKMREMELKEVVVKATRVKMFYRGDTLVYDATAFKLPDGSMLDALIRQMPGVTLNEAGQIFVNGRMVDELMLGSRSFFKGNRKVLLENLPYYTVQNIKVYDKQSDKSKALGYDVDPKQYVMDVNLKQEYQRGYIANVEGGIAPPTAPEGASILSSAASIVPPLGGRKGGFPLACPRVCPRLQRPLPLHAFGQCEQREREPTHRRIGPLDARLNAQEPAHDKERGGRDGLPCQGGQGEEQPDGLVHFDHGHQRVEEPL